MSASDSPKLDLSFRQGASSVGEKGEHRACQQFDPTLALHTRAYVSTVGVDEHVNNLTPIWLLHTQVNVTAVSTQHAWGTLARTRWLPLAWLHQGHLLLNLYTHLNRQARSKKLDPIQVYAPNRCVHLDGHGAHPW